MTRRTLIADGWATFAERVLPTDAGAVQRQETKRAFFAGAGEILNRILYNLDEGTEPTEPDLSMMDDIDHEIRQFVEDVKAGRQ